MTKLSCAAISLAILLFGAPPPVAAEPATPGLEMDSEYAGTPENDFGVGETDDPRRQTAQIPPASAGKKWTYMVTPYLWIPDSIEGTSTIGGAPPAPLDFDLSDVLDHLQFGASVRVEAWKGRLGLILDAMYVKLGDDISTPGPDLDVDIRQANVDFLVGYEVARFPTGASGAKGRDLSIQLLGGLRYGYLKQDIDVSGGPNFGGSVDWVEPVVGARLIVELSDKWSATVRGDVSGFSVYEEASNLTWNVLAGFDYRAWKNTSLKFGYRIYDIDYESGSGTDTLGLDAQMTGPWLGLTMYFN